MSMSFHNNDPFYYMNVEIQKNMYVIIIVYIEEPLYLHGYDPKVVSMTILSTTYVMDI